MSVEIKISELRNVVNRIMDHVETDLGHASVVLTEVDYWDVLDDDLYKPARPVTLGIGNLADDWSLLQHIRNGGEVAAPYELVHVGGLLRRIALQVRG